MVPSDNFHCGLTSNPTLATVRIETSDVFQRLRPSAQENKSWCDRKNVPHGWNPPMAQRWPAQRWYQQWNPMIGFPSVTPGGPANSKYRTIYCWQRQLCCAHSMPCLHHAEDLRRNARLPSLAQCQTMHFFLLWFCLSFCLAIKLPMPCIFSWLGPECLFELT